MFLLDNYDFLEELVKEGQLDNDSFYRDGFCLADHPTKPNTVYVFSFDNGVIWAHYGWTNKKNKSFLEFHRAVENIIFSFGMPILRVGKNHDYKNHTKYVGILNNRKVFQFIRS